MIDIEPKAIPGCQSGEGGISLPAARDVPLN